MGRTYGREEGRERSERQGRLIGRREGIAGKSLVLNGIKKILLHTRMIKRTRGKSCVKHIPVLNHRNGSTTGTAERGKHQ